MKRFTRYFFEGLIFLGPVVVTVYVVYIVFVKVDGIFRFRVPGIGVVVTILLITLFGFIASNFLTRHLVGTIDRLFRRLPLVKMIYTSLKDLVGAFVGEKRGFNKPVYVSLSPEGEVKVLGFITSERLEGLGLKDNVAVYLPQSYNFAGNLIVVPKEQVTPIEAPSGDIMTFIVSGGVSSKERHADKRKA